LCSLHDAISLERLGVPTVLLITEPFVAFRDRAAQSLGVDRYPSVNLHHPIAILSPEQVAAEVDRVAPNIVRALLQAPDAG